jgi:hypothetical protein
MRVQSHRHHSFVQYPIHLAKRISEVVQKKKPEAQAERRVQARGHPLVSPALAVFFQQMPWVAHHAYLAVQRWKVQALSARQPLPGTSYAYSSHSALGGHQYQRHCQGQHNVCGRMDRQAAFLHINSSSA